MRWPFLVLALWACKCNEPDDTGDPDEPEDEFCDAGEEAFIQKVMPLLWGRKPHGAYEVEIWAKFAEEHGRDNAVRAMSYDEAYEDRWRDWITDALAVARTGDRANPWCFGTPVMDDDGALARHLRDNPPDVAYGLPFTMADVVISGLREDDLSVIWRANLYARMTTPPYGANVSLEELEAQSRISFGDVFFETYLNRNLTCMGCHNSEYSVTGSDDPELDRTWEVPGLYEKALLGSSFGIDRDTAYAMFRSYDFSYQNASVAPWGWSWECGAFTPDDQLTSDMLGHEGYFIEAFGESGSVWDVEAALAEGIDLTANGVQLGDNNEVDGPSAFAALLSQSIADQVWEEATGERLTIANYFPRNQAQRDRLAELSNLVLTEHWSLRELLVAVATDPLYNASAPADCDTSPYGMSRIYNPWSDSEPEAEAQNNGPGDQVHRHPARTLIRSTHASLDWPQPDLFLYDDDPVAILETRLGARMRESQPGFNGTDLQSLLAYEDAYGACSSPYDVNEDFVDRLLNDAEQNSATVGDVVSALKDRLIQQSELTPDEQLLVEALLNRTLDEPASGSMELGLRQLCGVLLLSPDFYLHTDQGGAGAIPTLSLDEEEDCTRLQELATAVSLSSGCETGS